MSPLRRWACSAVATIALTGGLAACGSSAKPVAHVLYAGSLVSVMEEHVGPAFAHATGDGYSGYGSDSTELAQEIGAGVRTGDVYISASSTADGMLEHHGRQRVSWYVTFAKAPLVLAYNRSSHFAHVLRTEPWYQAIRTPGIRVGRTDPLLDPKGKLTVTALQSAARIHHLPAGFVISVEHSSQVFPETELVGRLDTGELDAAFLYSFEAADQHLPVVSLGLPKVVATFTVTVLSGAPDPSAGRAFVHFLLGPSGSALLRRAGLILLPHVLSGDQHDVPAGVVTNLVRGTPGAAGS